MSNDMRRLRWAIVGFIIAVDTLGLLWVYLDRPSSWSDLSAAIACKLPHDAVVPFHQDMTLCPGQGAVMRIEIGGEEL